MKKLIFKNLIICAICIVVLNIGYGQKPPSIIHHLPIKVKPFSNNLMVKDSNSVMIRDLMYNRDKDGKAIIKDLLYVPSRDGKPKVILQSYTHILKDDELSTK